MKPHILAVPRLWTIAVSVLILLLVSILPSQTTSLEASNSAVLSPSVTTSPAGYLDKLSQATYRNLSDMVEPSTGLPHDRFDAVLFDIAPQFAVVRQAPYVNLEPRASLP